MEQTERFSALTTETRNPRTTEVDLLPAEDIVRLMNEEDATVPGAVKAALPAVAGIARAAAASFARGRRLIYMGAGTSGRLGVLDAAECGPTFGVPVGAPDGTVIGLIAGGPSAMFKAVEGAEDSPELGEADLRSLNLSDRDTVVGIAASGRTPYVIGGLTYARAVGAVTGAVSCVPDAKISALADFAAEAVTGPEALTGSTRLKAGSAQKMMLNMISTAAFILSGKTYGNLMADVQITNEKLADRARRIVASAAECSGDEAAALLEASGRSPKTAIVMGLCGIGREEAEALLSQTAGHIRRAVKLGRTE
ncbi:MAG: N-acetylmuramic acid 6-phosphate etherase [Ruminococcaceae bacterium]|jgi:N-acetylmuramic acid 6-phosphate etherase|nr:N-acetylmuramic acid 6-phosphate etherase [Oscillospiraceae bacterium]